MPDPSKPTNDASTQGYKAFTNTGREDSTTEILKPQISAQVRQRYALIITVAVVLVAGLAYFAYLRNPINPFAREEDNHGFARPEPQVQ
jgi:hypothetical protein